MLLLASIVSCLHGVSASDTSTPRALTKFGELRFHPGYEARKDSFVSLAPVQSVSFRGARWTARDFYVSIRKGGKDIDIQWLEPLPAEGKKVVDTAYGPVSWRNGRLTSDLSLIASSRSPLLVQLDTAPTLESSLGWLEARKLVLSKDSTVSIDQDSIWLRLRTGLSLQPARILLRGPLSWKGAFPRQRIPPSNITSALWLDSLWLSGDRLEAKGVRHCPAQDTCRKYPWATLSLDQRLLQTAFEPNGHWPITRELGISWQGMARVDEGLPRFSSPRLVADLVRQRGLSTGWCDPTGAPLLSDSVSLVAVSQVEYRSIRSVHRCDDQGLLWKGNLRLDWKGRLSDGPLWTWTFEPTGIGIAGLRDEFDKPVAVFDSAVRDSFQAGGIEGLLRALPARRFYKVREGNHPFLGFLSGDTTSPVQVLFADGSRAKILRGRAALACGGMDTLSAFPIPVLVHRSGACLELENPPKTMTFANTSGWGSFVPGRIWTMLPFGRGFQVGGKWVLPKGIRERFRADSLPARIQTVPTQEGYARELPGTNWSSTLNLTIPVGWSGFEDLSGSSVFNGSLAGSKLRLSYEAPPEGPRIVKRLVSPYPESWKGRRVGLESGRFDLSLDNRLTDTFLVWSTFERYDRMEHPWGWIYQFSPPASARFVQQGSTEVFQEPQRYTRLSLPEDGNPNPVAKGLPKPNTPPLRAGAESSLPFSSLPPLPERAGRAQLSLDSVGAIRMDRLMATVAQYDSCVAAGKCSAVRSDSFADTGAVRVWKARAKWPESVQSGLDSIQARAFCAWRGARLPTQTQWRMVLRRTLGNLDSTRDLSHLSDTEHRYHDLPRVPGQLRPWAVGLFDLIGNGPIWCQGGQPCRIPRDSLCAPTVPLGWTYGVRCVE